MMTSVLEKKNDSDEELEDDQENEINEDQNSGTSEGNGDQIKDLDSDDESPDMIITTKKIQFTVDPSQKKKKKLI